MLTDADFSSPHFITLLIERVYLNDDENLPILREPIYINEYNLELLANVINEKVKYRLPVVYVLKTVYSIGIYFSNAAISHQRYLYHQYTGTDVALFNKVVRAVVQYSIVQNIKLTYYGDRRYWTTIAKTPSDDRTGDNVSGTICREMM